MITNIIRNIRECWLILVVCDLLFKATAAVLLIPLVSVLLRLFLWMSGREVLADTDIPLFLLHPIGIVATILVGGAVVCIIALEQSVLITICLGGYRNRRFRAHQVIPFVLVNAVRVFRLAAWTVLWMIILTAPFVLMAGAVYWLMLGTYDINFYLTEKPPEFWLAAVAIGLLLMGMITVWIERSAAWFYAVPILLFERHDPKSCLRASRLRTKGTRLQIIACILQWIGVNISIRFTASLLVIMVGQTIVPMVTHSISLLVMTVGGIVCLTGAVNYLSSLIANVSFASMQARQYLKTGVGIELQLPKVTKDFSRSSFRIFSLWRVLSGGVILALIAAIIGASIIRDFDIEDHVQITAHRGGGGVAPENSLSAIRMAIEARTDWVEIDVQESADGIIMVVHDSDLKKVAGNPIKIWQATAAELQAIDIGSSFSAEFRGEKMPTLDEVLETCKGKCGVNIELKYYGHSQQLETRVIEAVERYQMERSVVIMSLDAKGIAKVKQMKPTWKVGLLTAVSASDLTRAKADFLAVNSKIATAKFVRLAHRRGKEVHAWTINDGYMMSALISRGVDNIITDYPALARQVLKERDELSPTDRLMVELSFYLGAKQKPGGAP